MDPSFYSPQPSAKVHAVCYCRVHGKMAASHTPNPPRKIIYHQPVNPIVMQQPVIFKTGQTTTHVVPCQVVYHHQPVYGQMVNQSSPDGATAIARQRRQQQSNPSKKCQNPNCQQHNNNRSKSRSRKAKSGQNGSKSATLKPHKSAPSSPSGTPKKLVKPHQTTAYFKNDPLNAQWISAYPPVETPTAETSADFPRLTGCCGRTSLGPRRPLSNSYSALDSVASEESSYDLKSTNANKNQVVSECVKSMVSWVTHVGDKVGKGTSALIDALPSLKEDHHVVMVGLDSAGKSTVLYRLKFDQYVNTVPTIGFNCERVRGSAGRSRGLTFLVWDVGGQEKVRPLWRPYTRATDAIIFVVDSTDVERMEEAKLELHRIMRTPENVGVPLLVIANKQDLPTAKSGGELEKYLGLNEFGPGQLWHLEPACAVTGEGLDFALDSTHELIVKRKKQKKRARNKTR